MVAVLIAASLLATACGRTGKGPNGTAGGSKPTTDLAAQVASYDLVTGRSGRFLVGLLAGDQGRLVAFGTVNLSFTYLGSTAAGNATGKATKPVTATFLPIPGQTVDPTQPGPRFVKGSEGIGVYGASDVSFDKPGFWNVTASANIEGTSRRAQAAFQVLDHSPIPAVGTPALHTDNPVAGANGVDPRSIDSRAGEGAPIPDPELHATSIAAALDAKRPLMIVISTPTYCVSRFCGPITDSVSALAKRYVDRMAFVHLEVWKDFEKNDINPAAAAWIFPPGAEDAREPWVFVVDRDGQITHRFDNVATDAELEQAVVEATS